MDARWEPASTAKTEFLTHFAAMERTRNPVTLSSLGPPPEPCKRQYADARYCHGTGKRRDYVNRNNL
jgi:hypothetical protein